MFLCFRDQFIRWTLITAGANLNVRDSSFSSFYERRSAVCLQMRSMNLDTWVETIANELVYCDELALMGLCNMYHRHCVVLTQNKLWSTVQADKPLNLLDLLNICSVRLIYLGNLHFGVLTWRPHLPKKVATQSPGFNIIEEYTLDDANSAASVDKGNRKPPEHTSQVGNVETDKLSHKSLQCSEGTTNTSTVVTDKTEIASKANSTDLNKLASQGATAVITQPVQLNNARRLESLLNCPHMLLLYLAKQIKVDAYHPANCQNQHYMWQLKLKRTLRNQARMET